MIKYLQNFFYPPAQTYLYNKNKNEVVAKVHEILENLEYNSYWPNTNDLKGYFVDDDNFYIKTNFPINTNSIRCNSKLYGTIAEDEHGTTVIITKEKINITLYILFFLFIFFGIISFYQFLKTGMKGCLLWSAGMIFGGPTLSICISNIAGAAIIERYDMYIDSELKLSTSFQTQ